MELDPRRVAHTAWLSPLAGAGLGPAVLVLARRGRPFALDDRGAAGRGRGWFRWRPPRVTRKVALAQIRRRREGQRSQMPFPGIQLRWT